MTIAGGTLPRPSALFNELSREEWVEVDGDTLIKLEINEQEEFSSPVLILVHGLSGSSQSPYMLGVAQKAWLQNWHVIRLNIRNCGGSETSTPTLYHAAMTDDLEATLNWVSSHFSSSLVAIAGFSLGGAIAVHTVSKIKDSIPENLKAMVTVSTPYNLMATSNKMHRGFMNRIYMKRFLKGFIRSMRRKAARYPELYPRDADEGYEDFYSFDRQWTAPSFGFDSPSDYYDRASALHVLPKVNLPTLVIHSEDDPLVTYCDKTHMAIAQNTHVRLLLTQYGGHCAFFGLNPAVGPSWQDVDRWWAENRLIQFCAHQFGISQKKQCGG